MEGSKRSEHRRQLRERVDLGKVSEETQNRIVIDQTPELPRTRWRGHSTRARLRLRRVHRSARGRWFAVYERATGRMAPTQRNRRLATWTATRS
jgi:hypothetical protein